MLLAAVILVAMILIAVLLLIRLWGAPDGTAAALKESWASSSPVWAIAVVAELFPTLTGTSTSNAGDIPEWYGPSYRPEGTGNRRVPFTEEIQKEIWWHQNPASCEGKRFAVVHNWKGGGMGSLVHVVGAALAWAWNNDRILVYGSDFGSGLSHGSYCKDDATFTCFFQPLSMCKSPGPPTGETDVVVTVQGAKLSSEIPSTWKQTWLDSGHNSSIKHWWRGQSAAYILRLNDRTSEVLRSSRLLLAASEVAPLPLPQDTVSIHVRHGDKYKEMSLKSWDDHVSLAEAMAADRHFSGRHIFLSTEDPEVVEEASQEEAWSIMVLPWRRSNENHQELMAMGDSLFIFSLVNLFLAVEAQHFVGTRGSNWNRLIDELRQVWPADPVGCCNAYGEVTCADLRSCNLDAVPGQW